MIYVTGSKGFLGTHLTSKLEDFISIPHDKIQTTKLKPFDRFFFCSSYGNLNSQQEEDLIYKANIEDLLSILKQIKHFKFKSFVFISTSSVGLRTQTTYSRCKRAAEEILLAFMEKNDLPVCIVRPFTIYGPGDNPAHLIPTILRSLDGEQMNFVPSPSHDYIFIDDVVDGILSLSEHGARGIYQLGYGKSYSNQEVLDLIEDITGKKAKINLVDSMRVYDTQDWFSNNYKARGYGWMPKYNLRQGLEEIVK
jgi:nucleoside-diphosphate-sugar epimerase